VKADEHFPICVGGCGRRGKTIVWYQISENVRFGECLHCYDDRMARVERAERLDALSGATGPDLWDPPPEDPTGPEEGKGRPLPWVT
jgi:hypothetical protein